MGKPVTLSARDEALIQRWIEEVYSYADVIDPDHERDWYDMAIGFFLGARYTEAHSDFAYDLANECRVRGVL